VFYVRDSIDYAPGVRQFVYLDGPARYIWAGYQFNAENAVVNTARLPQSIKETPPPPPLSAYFNEFAYQGNQVVVGAGWSFPWPISAEVEYDYRHESYDEASAFFNAGVRRRDNINQASAVVSKQLNEYLDVSAGWLGTYDDSNNPNFTYNRNIVSLTVGGVY